MNIVKYHIVNNKEVNKKIVLLSDIHYYEPQNLRKLNKILEIVKKINPDYICLPGDFTDEVYVKRDDLFLDWLGKLSLICKVIIGVGNHDITLAHEKKEVRNNPIFDKIRKIENVKLLDNEEYIDEKIRFIGITLPYNYYRNFKEKGKYLVNYLNDNYTNYSSDKYNILICHSPIITLKYYDEINIFKTINLTLYGHMHGGLMPKFLRRIFKDRGLISPRLKLFPRYVNNYLKDKNAIISSGVTKFSHTNKFYKLDFIFDSEITVINLKEEK